MTRDDIIRMAREAGLSNDFGNLGYPYLPELERFANLVAAAEREMSIDVMKQAPEPVAWYHPKSSRVRFENPNSLLWTPLYTAPRQWQGLTDDEKRSLVEWAHPDIIDAIELRLRERNNG